MLLWIHDVKKHMENIIKVKQYRTKKKLIHSCILRKLNFCSSLYFKLPKKELRKLDKLLNASVRVIGGICGHERK